MAIPTDRSHKSYVNFAFVKESIDERLTTYGLDKTWFTEERLWSTFVDLLHDESPDYYQRRVRTLCPQLSEAAIRLESLTQNDLREVWNKMESLWPLQPIPVFTTCGGVNAYVFCKKSLGGAQESCVMAHIKILEALFMGNCHDPQAINNVLCLAFWVFLFYSKKQGDTKHRKTYNSTAHVFHSDLVITFLALKCWYSPCYYSHIQLPDLPKFKQSIIHHGISPEHPAFQSLVLQQALKIVNPKTHFGAAQTPLEQAKSLECHLAVQEWLWKKKEASGILTIVKDQSRYMALRQPDLRRNFVAEKVRCQLSAATKRLQGYLVDIKARIEDKPNDALEIFCFIMEETSGEAVDDRCRLPPVPDKPHVENKKLLNSLHHLILVDICKGCLGNGCPKVDKNFRFEDVQFVHFLQSLANKVIQYAFWIPKSHRSDNLYPLIAMIAVALQKIIAARWYISEVEQRSNIEASEDLVQHQKIIFVLLAFRTIMMYLLPQNPSAYGVQRVAATLPQYAQNLRFFFPLLSI